MSQATKTPLTKLQKSGQIILAMQFLGIKKSRFIALEAKFGGLDGLYAEMERRLGA